MNCLSVFVNNEEFSDVAENFPETFFRRRRPTPRQKSVLLKFSYPADLSNNNWRTRDGLRNAGVLPNIGDQLARLGDPNRKVMGSNPGIANNSTR